MSAKIAVRIPTVKYALPSLSLTRPSSQDVFFLYGHNFLSGGNLSQVPFATAPSGATRAGVGERPLSTTFLSFNTLQRIMMLTRVTESSWNNSKVNNRLEVRLG